MKISKNIFILLGENNTGKTTFQKKLIFELSGKSYDKLHCNKVFNISKIPTKTKFNDIFIGNRSIQEKIAEYIDIKNYFKEYVKAADIMIISSHLCQEDIRMIIDEVHMLYRNAISVFFENSIKTNVIECQEISKFNWDNRIVLPNKLSKNDIEQDDHLNSCVNCFIENL